MKFAIPWEEYVVFHHKLKQWMSVKANSIQKKIIPKKNFKKIVKNPLTTKPLPMMWIGEQKFVYRRAVQIMGQTTP